MVPLYWRQFGHSSKTKKGEGGHSVQLWAGLDSGLCSLKQLLLVIQQEFGEGIDGIDGF